MTKIKLQKGQVKYFFPGLGWDIFKVQEIETKIIELGEIGYIKENCLPQEIKVIKDWESKTEIIKIRG